MSSLYLRGKTWWMKYHVNGVPVRKSTGSKDKKIAKEVLLKVENDLAMGKSPYTNFGNVYFENISELILQDYKINKKASINRLKRSIGHLKKTFSGYSVPSITTTEIGKYIEKRIGENAANATINRELAALKRMLRLGAFQTPSIVEVVPKINMLSENNIREGFFEHHDYVAIRNALPKYLYGLITFAYQFGWRSYEIRNITWDMVDTKIWTVRIDGGLTKNNKARTVYLNEELISIFKDLRMNQLESNNLKSYVFLNAKKTGPVKDFRKAWNNAFKKTKIKRLLFHDLRRTAVRNMVRAGVPENVAMKISGHITRSVFDRYDIVNDRDIIEATRKQDEYMKHYSMGTNLGTHGKIEN